MADDKREDLAELSEEELKAQDAEQLPERDEMSLVNANVAAPINLAAALNVLSDDSTATGDASQTAPIGQGNA
jgi:2-polyprenyl-6-methoxyphenol hydroxylase-like FAD-dependent oxidoreductase